MNKEIRKAFHAGVGFGVAIAGIISGSVWSTWDFSEAVIYFGAASTKALVIALTKVAIISLITAVGVETCFRARDRIGRE